MKEKKKNSPKTHKFKRNSATSNELGIPVVRIPQKSVGANNALLCLSQLNDIHPTRANRQVTNR